MSADRPRYLNLRTEAYLMRLTGGAMGWKCASDWDIVVYEKIADAIGKNNEKKFKVERTQLNVDGRLVNGVKIYNQDGRDLSDFWRIVEDVNELTKYQKVPQKELRKAIRTTLTQRELL